MIYTVFDIYFMAYNIFVFLCYTRHTLPNPPFPIAHLILNDFFEIAYIF